MEFRSELKETEGQHRNECCPNLNLDSIGAGPYKGFDLKIVLQGFEEDFHLATVSVRGGISVSCQTI